jgi:ribosomal-protein-alanine N-acetyltransferase
MRRRHVREILAIEERVYPKPWTSGVFSSEIDLARRGERYYVVAKDGEQVVGYAGLMFAIDEAHVTNIAIDPTRHRQGIARLLMAHIAQQAIVHKSEALTLEVRVSNTAAQELYRHFGFAPAGVRQRYYENTEDALVMWAHDIQDAAYQTRLENVMRGSAAS